MSGPYRINIWGDYRLLSGKVIDTAGGVTLEEIDKIHLDTQLRDTLKPPLKS